jgi:hypothetical protein
LARIPKAGSLLLSARAFAARRSKSPNAAAKAIDIHRKVAASFHVRSGFNQESEISGRLIVEQV